MGKSPSFPKKIIGLPAASGVTAELSKSSALSMEEAVSYTDMNLGATVPEDLG